jgi:carboxynorspermidine decarboxylase
MSGIPGATQMPRSRVASTENTLDVLQLETPAFVYDEGAILDALTRLRRISSVSGCKVLFSLKAFTMVDALRLMIPALDGFAASSLFEAKLAGELLTLGKTLHLTTPGLKADELDDIAELCDYLSFNSITQWDAFRERVGERASCGVRVNPQLSYVADDRYDPCRPGSKLGIPLPLLVENLADNCDRFQQLRGIHFHTNCESSSVGPLLETVTCLVTHLGDWLGKLEWINLGGGYLYQEVDPLEPLYDAVELLSRKYDLEVFLEPGEAIVGEAGYVVSSVVDLFENDGKRIAILDTTVNHLPGVFSYQSKPQVTTATSDGEHRYLLAGSTCLAGDLFGAYEFDHPLEIGSRITFAGVGGYSLVKANMFNGVNLPNIYSLTEDRQLVLKRKYTLKDFLAKWESNEGQG